jgi:hypothetical protein
LRLALSITLLGTTLLQGACAPKAPPTLPNSDAKSLVVPMPPPPKDASLFGYLKIRDVKQTMDLAGGAMLNVAAASKGINLAEIEAGKPAAFFFWDPGGASSPQTVPAAALLPLPAQGELVTRLKDLAQSVEVEAVGDGTMAAMNAEVAAKARTERPGLLEILNAPILFDGLLYINSATILDKYLPVMRQGLHNLEPLLAAAAVQRKDAPSPKATLGMLESFLGSMESLRAVAIGAKPYDGGLEISTLVQQRQPEPGGPIAAPDLAQFLPPADLRVVWNIREVKKTLDFYLRTYGPLLDEKPGLRAQVQALADELSTTCQHMDSAIGFKLGGERGFSSQGLMRVDNPAAFLKIIAKIVPLFNEGPIHDSYKSMGIDLQIVHTPNTRKLKGWPVERYQYRVTLGPEVTEPSLKLIWEKIAGSTYEVAQIGPYVAFASNSSLEELVNSLFTGKGSSPMKATTVFPAGGHLYVDLNLPSMFAGLKSMLPEPLAQKMPTLPAGMDPVLLFGYDSGETGYYKLRLPGPLLVSLANAFH